MWMHLINLLSIINIDFSKINLPSHEDGSLPWGYVNESVSAMVWPFPPRGSEENLIYPELRIDTEVGKWLSNRKDIGIAMSGGGMRAASCALGWLRSFQRIGLLSRSRYLSVNSGASWIALPLSAKDILEKKENDKDIDLNAHLGTNEDSVNPGIVGKIIANANIANGGDTSKAPFVRWIRAVDEYFVQPLNITNAPDFYYDMCNGYLWNDTPVPRLDDKRLPYLLAAATVGVVTNPKTPKEKTILLPFEFTSLYCGIPMDPTDMNGDIPVGSGFLQSIAFNTKVDEPIDAIPYDASNTDTTILSLPRPPQVFKIAEITGISSSAPAMYALEKETQKGFTSMITSSILGLDSRSEAAKYSFWSPTRGGPSYELTFADGGYYDNTGILALLRRGVKSIIACYSANKDFLDDSTRDANAYDLASLFGAARTSTKEKENQAYNDNLVVFENGPKEWSNLLTALKAKRKAGQPLIHSLSLSVKANRRLGVYKTYPVKLLLVIHSHADKFTATLPNDLQKLIKKRTIVGTIGGLFGGGVKDMANTVASLNSYEATVDESFPYIDTAYLNYDDKLVGCLSKLCSWSIDQEKELIQNFINDA